MDTGKILLFFLKMVLRAKMNRWKKMHDDTCKVLYLHVLCAIMELFQIRSMASEAWATITKREKWNRSYREVKI